MNVVESKTSSFKRSYNYMFETNILWSKLTTKFTYILIFMLDIFNFMLDIFKYQIQEHQKSLIDKAYNSVYLLSIKSMFGIMQLYDRHLRNS